MKQPRLWTHCDVRNVIDSSRHLPANRIVCRRSHHWQLTVALMVAASAFSGTTVAQPPAAMPPAAMPFTELKLEVGTAFRTADSVIIELEQRPSNNKVNLPRMANVIRQVRWLGRDSESSMSLHSEIDVWTVQLKDVPDVSPLRLELVTDTAPLAFNGKVVAAADDTGVITLPAKFAKTHGEKLRFEPQPHKNTVGYWTVASDFAEWHFRSAKANTYDVEIFQGCGKGHGGSDIEVRVGDRKVALQVKDTGHFQNFLWRSLGQLQVPEGDDIRLTLVAIRKAGGAVMDCRQIRLIPADNRDPALRFAGQESRATP